MLIGGIVAGLVLGLLAGGSLANLAAVRLRWVGWCGELTFRRRRAERRGIDPIPG